MSRTSTLSYASNLAHIEVLPPRHKQVFVANINTNLEPLTRQKGGRMSVIESTWVGEDLHLDST